jgi:hypothetical protein
MSADQLAGDATNPNGRNGEKTMSEVLDTKTPVPSTVVPMPSVENRKAKGKARHKTVHGEETYRSQAEHQTAKEYEQVIGKRMKLEPESVGAITGTVGIASQTTPGPRSG